VIAFGRASVIVKLYFLGMERRLARGLLMMDDSGDFSPSARTGSKAALLVDGENISQEFAARMIHEAQELGQLVVCRVYGNVKLLPHWDAAPGFRFIHSGAGKNSADMMIVIDALDFAHSGGVTCFFIASSDGDFAHLARHLRERHFQVIGLGEAKAPAAFRMACTQFIELKSPRLPPVPSAVPPTAGPSDLDKKIYSMIAKHSTKGSGMLVSLMGAKMHSSHKTHISTHPERTWRGYLAARPHLYTLDPKGKDAHVRFVAAAFNALKP